MASRTIKILRQIIPVIIGSLLGVSFGTMLGWPSITFPLLVDPEITPIPITWDQSAMIAGFLMEGNIIGTGFSSITFVGSKTGILVSCGCQIAGWIAMFCAQDIPGIGVSRALVGFGNGFGLGQLRIYAQESCEPHIFQLLMQYMPLAVNVGVILVYTVGGFVSFRVLSLVFVVVPIVNMILFAAIPKKINNSSSESSLEAVENIETVYQSKRAFEITKVEDEKQQAPVQNSESTQLGFIGAFRDKHVRNSLFLLWFLIFIPQYTGGAANIVYSQVIHIAALNPYPKVCSIIYSFVFLFSNIAALKYTNKFPRKPVLLGSCFICSLLLCSVCFYFYFLVDLLEVSTLFVWSPLFLLSLFNFFHTMGVNTVPILLITDKFPENARVVASKFYVMYFSLSAVISTKIFQVIFTYCGMHLAYVFLSSVGLGSAFIVLCLVKEPSHSINNPDIDGFYNDVDLKDEIPTTKNNFNMSENHIEMKGRSMAKQKETICHANGLQNQLVLKDEIVTCGM